MSRKDFVGRLVILDHWSWLLFVAWFSLGLVLYLTAVDTAGRFSSWGIILMLVCYHVRLVMVAEHFRQTGQPRYHLLAYLLFALLLVSIAIQLVRE